MKNETIVIPASGTPAAETPKTPARARIRQDKFSTLRLPCFRTPENKLPET